MPTIGEWSKRPPVLTGWYWSRDEFDTLRAIFLNTGLYFNAATGRWYSANHLKLEWYSEQIPAPMN